MHPGNFWNISFGKGGKIMQMMIVDNDDVEKVLDIIKDGVCLGEIIPQGEEIV